MIFGQLTKRSTLENPSTNLRDFFLDGEANSFTGRSVNERTALTFTAFWACVRYLSNAIAMPPLRVLERKGEERHPARDHRNWTLLHDRPNPEMSSFQWRETGMGHLLTWGNFYCERGLDGNQQTRALWPISPDRVSVVKQGGAKYLAVSMRDGNIVKLPPAKYMHVAGPGYDGMTGYSVVSMMKQAIGLGLSEQEHSARFYGSGGRIPFLVKSPLPMKKEAQDRFRKAWQETHGGDGEGQTKSRRIAILDEGMDIAQLGMSEHDNETLASKQWSAEEMARGFGVPQHKIQLLQNADFSNITQQAVEAVTDAVMPWAIRFEQTYNWELFTEIERRTFYTKHGLDILLRGDAKTRAEALEVRRRNGTLNADEWRALEDENPLPNGQGQKYIVESNMQDLDKVGESVPDPIDPDRSLRAVEISDPAPANMRSAKQRAAIHTAYVQLFERAAQHFVTREARAALRFLKRAFDTPQPLENLIALLDEFYRTFGDTVRNELLPVVTAMAQLVRREIETETGTDLELEEIERFAARFVSDYSDRHVKSSLRQIQKIAQETPSEGLQEALRDRFTSWEETRAGSLATREAHRAGNAIGLTAYTMAGVLTLYWRNTGSSTCPICQKMNGRSVVTGSAFLNDGDIVAGDDTTADLHVRKTIKHPPGHAGCDCVLGA